MSSHTSQFKTTDGQAIKNIDKLNDIVKVVNKVTDTSNFVSSAVDIYSQRIREIDENLLYEMDIRTKEFSLEISEITTKCSSTAPIEEIRGEIDNATYNYKKDIINIKVENMILDNSLIKNIEDFNKISLRK